MPPDPTIIPADKDAPKPARLLDYAPPLTWAEKVRRFLPRGERVADFLKSMVWVAPLTLLIWIYAEREQAVIQPGVTIPIEVRTTDASRLVTLRRPPDKLIVVELSGSRASLDRVLERVRAKDNGAPVQIVVDEKLATGGKELLTVRELNQLPVFRDSGITVKSAQPPYLFVDIDQYEERELPIQVSDDAAKLINNEHTRFDPPRVAVRAPSQLFKTAEQSGKPLAVTADLSQRAELKARTDRQDMLKLDNVPVTWEHRENVTIKDQTVTAWVEVKRQDKSHIIPSVGVNLQTPPGFLEEGYTVTYTPKAVSNFEVLGPPEVIDQIRANQLVVQAVLVVLPLDVGKQGLRRKLKVDLPPGVTIAPDTAKRLEWEFSVTAK